MKAKDFYEQERVKGSTEDITGNPNPDYNNRFYSEIFELMENFAIEAIKADREDAAENIKLKYEIWKGGKYIQNTKIDEFEAGIQSCKTSDKEIVSIDKFSITDRPLPTFKQ